MATDRTTHPAPTTAPAAQATAPAAPAVPAAVPGAGSATAVAHPNIALVKYWGKRDEALVLPATGSLSMTLDVFPTTTNVTLVPGATRDEVRLNGQAATGQQRQRVVAFLELVRAGCGSGVPALVESVNTVPTGAGLASSASGFAALAVAAAAAYGLHLDAAGLSRLARRGSGSASRSLIASFAQWHAGTGDLDQADRTSYAEPVPAHGALDPALVVAVLDAGPKKVSSREAMRRTVQTSPLYRPWADSSTQDLSQMRLALAAGDLERVGEIAERNALGMHATMLAARPAVRYLAPDSLRVLDAVAQLRADGVCAYATMDAGPNVKVLCERGQAPRVAAAITGVVPGARLVTAGPGPAAALLVPGASR